MFPGLRDPAKIPISAETINKALKILGFEGEQTGHGFRGLASTIMNERSGAQPEVIERQLAHKDRNLIRRAYSHAEYLDERRQLMQWWSDYLDQCAGTPEKNEGMEGLPLFGFALPLFLPLNLLAPLGSTLQPEKQKAAKSKTYAAFKAVLGTTLQEFGRRYWNRTNDLHDVNVAL